MAEARPTLARADTDGSSVGAGCTPWQKALFALLLLVPLLAGLASTPLFDVDEGAFSEATREMVASGDWGHTTLNGEDRFDKPIGVYWLQAASVSVFGAEPFAFRLPSVLSGWLLAISLAVFAAPRWGLLAGALAGVLAVTSLGPMAIFRAATADALLNLLLVLAGLDLWRFAESGRRAPLRRAYAWVGLGLLVKGPVAVLVPGAAFLVWVASSRRWDRLRQAALDGWGWLLLVAIAAPWYAYALHRHGMAFIEGFLFKHNLQRFSGPMEGHGGSMVYYLAALPLLAMPWLPLLVRVVTRARAIWRDDASPAGRYLLGWAGFVLLFFSLSGTKLPHYVLYGYPPLVLLMAQQLAGAGRRLRGVAWAFLFGWTLLMAWLPWQVQGSAAGLRDPFFAAMLGGSPLPKPGAVVLALGLMLLAMLAPFALRHQNGRISGLALAPGPACWHLGTAALVMAGYIGFSLSPWWGEALQGPVQRAAAAAASAQAQIETAGRPAPRVVQYRLHLPSFAVYLEQEVPRSDPAPTDMALTRVDRLTPADRQRAVLFSERGLVLLGPQP